MKPILIDALHINMGGAYMILNHFVTRLVANRISFTLLKDVRCPRLNDENHITNLIVMSSDLKSRYDFYKSHKYDFRSVLCLGNVPPPIKLNVPVHTYIHNVSLLMIPKDNTLFQKMSNRLKRTYIRWYSKNTDTWIVQTSNTANLVNKYINKRQLPIKIYPFYHIPNELKKHPSSRRKDYVFVGEYTGAKGHEYLIEAWVKLAQMGIKSTLHLTVSTPNIAALINEAIAKGAYIVNHGYVPFSQVMDLYKISKATVYPSLNESLGLGIIEAAEAGCDVIGCDLPYIYSICKPSETFEQRNSDSIVKAVVKYENNNSPKTILSIRDTADSLIKFMQ